MLRTLTLAGLGLALAASQAHAWGWTQPIPIKIDTQFTYRFNVYIGPGNVFRPPHPWWAYFPADAGQQLQQPLTPFPNWPQQPPVVPTGRQLVPQMTQGYAPWAGQAAWTQPVASPWQVQPVGYQTPMQAPAYWYGR